MKQLYLISLFLLAFSSFFVIAMETTLSNNRKKKCCLELKQKLDLDPFEWKNEDVAMYQTACATCSGLNGIGIATVAGTTLSGFLSAWIACPLASFIGCVCCLPCYATAQFLEDEATNRMMDESYYRHRPKSGNHNAVSNITNLSFSQ